MSLEILKKQLSENDISGIYVFTGKEDYLKKFYINKIKTALRIPEDDAFNYLSVNAQGLTGLQVDDYCQAAPVFAEKKLLYISCFDSDEMSADVADVFKNLEGNYPDWCVIIVDEQGTEHPVAKNFTFALSENIEILKVDIPLRNVTELCTWILRHASAEKINMSKSAAEYLLSVTDNNMYNLSSEMAKLFAASDTVDEALIDKMVIKTVDARIFDLTDAILACDAAKAMELFGDLYEKNPDTMIMGAIYNCFTRLYQTALYSNQGLSKNDIAKKMAASPFAVGKNLNQLSRISINELREIIELCAQADDSLKRFAKDKKMEIEIFILQLINKLK